MEDEKKTPTFPKVELPIAAKFIDKTVKSVADKYKGKDKGEYKRMRRHSLSNIRLLCHPEQRIRLKERAAMGQRISTLERSIDNFDKLNDKESNTEKREARIKLMGRWRNEIERLKEKMATIEIPFLSIGDVPGN